MKKTKLKELEDLLKEKPQPISTTLEQMAGMQVLESVGRRIWEKGYDESHPLPEDVYGREQFEL